MHHLKDKNHHLELIEYFALQHPNQFFHHEQDHKIQIL
jgi:hypothetical protein